MNRSQHSMGIMQEALADTLIEQAFEAIEPDGFVTFAFQGGEPTIAGLPFFQHFVEKVRECCPVKGKVNFSIQTNGMLLDDAWVRFFKESNFLVGLSIDGFRDAHETHRVDSCGGGTWKKVLTAKTLLEKYNVEYNALCVVTCHCASHPEKAYKTLKQLGFRYIQFIACLDPIGHNRGSEPWSLSPEAYGKFLCRVFDLWYQDWRCGNYCSIRLFEDYVHTLLGDGASACSTCGKCGSYLVIEGDGSGYPCDFYVLDQWKIGSLPEMTITQMVNSTKAAAFLRWGTEKPAECSLCPYARLCNGGCKNDWYEDQTGPHNYFCSAFRTFLDHSFPYIRQIALEELKARYR